MTTQTVIEVHSLKELPDEAIGRLTKWLAAEGFIREYDRVGCKQKNLLYTVNEVLPHKVLVTQLVSRKGEPGD